MIVTEKEMAIALEVERLRVPDAFVVEMRREDDRVVFSVAYRIAVKVEDFDRAPEVFRRHARESLWQGMVLGEVAR